MGDSDSIRNVANCTTSNVCRCVCVYVYVAISTGRLSFFLESMIDSDRLSVFHPIRRIVGR